jgi:BMFP domain-containing protein YqiC
MKKLLVAAAAAALAMSFAASADAATHKQKVSANVETSCKAQAAKKFSAIHFMKRRNFVNNCVAQRGSAHKSAKAKTENKSNANNQTARPATTGQAPKAQTTGQAPKAQ